MKKKRFKCSTECIDHTLNMAIFASSPTLKAFNTKKNTSDSEWGDN